MITPAAAPITTPPLPVATLNQPCTCAGEFPGLYADVVRLHGLMADGMTQRAASAFLWGMS